MIQLEEIEKSFGGQRLFSGLSWSIPTDGSMIGLVGPNGAGKSTLLQIVCGIVEPDGGQIHTTSGLEVGYLPQEVTPDVSRTVLETILLGAGDLLETESELERLQSEMDGTASDAEIEQLSQKYSELEEYYRAKGGYEIRGKAKRIARGLGFEQRDFERPLREFSGGWRVRAGIGRILISTNDVLLLDEPTNHLDLESIRWLTDYLDQISKTVVLISHDRTLLNRAADEIAELWNGRLKVYQGNYDEYVEAREKYREELAKKAREQQKEIEEMEAFIQKFRYNASKASLVQSRIKRLEKMEPIEVPPAYKPDTHIDFPQPERVPKKVIELQEVSKRYADNVIYDGLDLTLWRGDRVAVAGPNGAGKSTLLKLIAGTIDPDDGQIRIPGNISIGYFAQHSLDQLTAHHTIFSELREACPTASKQQIRDVLGGLQIRGDEVEKKIHQLSGGEKARVVLAKILAHEHHLLLMDEPTNHLDIPAREVLELALQNFNGVVVVVSHDQTFLEKTTEKVWYVSDGKVNEHLMSFDVFRRKLEQQNRRDKREQKSGGSGGDGLSRKEKRRLAAEVRKERSAKLKPVERQLEAVEQQLEDAEARVEELEQILADPATYEERDDIESLQKEHGELENKVLELLEKWESLQLEVEQIRDEFEERLQQKLRQRAADSSQ